MAYPDPLAGERGRILPPVTRPKPKPKPKPKPRPTVPVDPLVIQATASVDAGVNATLAAIRAEQERAEKAARDRASQIGQFTQALAETLKGIGPQIQAGYQTAANTQATFGKGYSDAMKVISSGNATDTNSFLQNVVGAPAGQQISPDKATAAADVLYGLGGRIPAGSFAAQGAGYGAAAGAYPMQAGQQGQFLAAQELAKGAEERARYQALIDEQIGKRPGLIKEAVEKARKEKDAAAKERYEQAIDLYNADLLTQRGLAQALGLPDWKGYPQVTKSQAKPADFQFRTSGGYIWRVDPKTGEVTQAGGSGPAPKTPPRDRIVHYQDALGREHTLNLDTREDTLLPGPAAPGKKKYTRVQLEEKTRIANNSAEDAFYGIWDDENYKWILEPKSYQEAMIDLLRKGQVPLPIAQKALNFYWKRPGYDRELVMDWKTGKPGKPKIKWFKDKSGSGRPVKPYQEKQGAGPKRYSKSAGDGVVAPLDTPMGGGSEFAVPDAEGAPSSKGGKYHAAKDWFAPAGSTVAAPVSGTVVEATPARGYSGQVYGGVVKVRAANGRVYVFRHVDPAGVRVGQKITVGEPIAAVSNWLDNPNGTHAHIEVWKTLGGGYRFENMIDPAEVFGT